MGTHRVRRLVTLVTAVGLLLLTLLTSSACKGQSPVAPEGATPGGSPADPAGAAGNPDELVSFAPEAPHDEASGSSRPYASPVSADCVPGFYDSAFYDWYAFQNVCGQPIIIDYIPKSPGYGVPAMTLGASQKGSTGYPSSGMRMMRGYQLFVCPAGYMPVDANNRYVTQVHTPFRCPKQ